MALHRQTPSGIEIQALRVELDAANKKVDRYVNLVATLSEELDNLRRGICHNCKKKFVPSCSPVYAPRPSLWRRIVRDYQPPNPLVSALEHRAKPVIPSPPQISSCTTLDEIQPSQPECSVAYNPEIKQALHVDLVKTFNVTTGVFCVKFSPDGKYLAVGDDSGKTYIFNVEKRLNICTLADYSLKVQPIIWHVQFSPDSKYVATAGAGRIRVWEIARKRTMFMFQHGATAIYSTSFSPDGRFLVSGDEGGSIRKWRIRDGHFKMLMQRNHNLSVSVNFSPNGRYIASVHMNGLLRIWDARTNQLVHEWMAHTRYAYCLAFTPDGTGLVSGGEDKTLKFWDVSSLVLPTSSQRQMIDGGKFKQILLLEGHTKSIRSVAVCPDNRWVVTSSYDRSVRIWDPRTATLQCTLQHNSARGVDFCPAGTYLANGGEDGHVRLWRYRKA